MQTHMWMQPAWEVDHLLRGTSAVNAVGGELAVASLTPPTFFPVSGDRTGDLLIPNPAHA